ISGLYHAALTPAAYASRTMLPPSLQDSLPAGWLAFAGRASTLWIAAKGFRSSILLFWTWPGAREVSFEPPSPFTSLDHLVGEREQPVRNLEAERLGGLEVDAQLDFRGLYHRQVGRLFTLEKATGVKSDLSVLLCQADSVTDEPSRDYELMKQVHGRNRMACRKFNEALDPIVKERITPDEQRPGSLLDQAREGGVDFAVGACFQYLNL